MTSSCNKMNFFCLANLFTISIYFSMTISKKTNDNDSNKNDNKDKDKQYQKTI